MRDRYAAEVSTANQFEGRGNFGGAVVHWIAAAENAADPLERIAALTEVRRCAEEAFARSVAKANASGIPWREIAPHTDMAWQTLHRRYGHIT